jgi:tetratricopeptide (TPR) repeat protein
MADPLTQHDTPAPALQPAPAMRPWMLFLVALLALGAYANSLANDFALDDLAIAHGPHVVNLDWIAIWTENYWPNVNGVAPDALYRPLTLWSYIANQALLPDVAWPFHLVNISLHALVCVLASILAWRLLNDRRIALVTGILFAVHPIHTEVVANTVGRAELLAALWSLLAILIFLPRQPLACQSGPTRRRWPHGILVALCFLAAIFSKETPVTLLLAFPLLDLWRWTRWQPPARPKWWRWLASQTLRYYAPMTAAFGLYMVLRIRACGLMTDIRATHHIVNPLVEATPIQRLVTPFCLFAKYIWLMFWPVHLSADYSSPSLLATANPFYATSMQPPAAAGLMLSVLAVVLAYRTWRKFPQIALLLAFFATSYMLVANFLRIGTIFGERLFYWPSVFFLMMLSWALVAAHRTLAGNWLKDHPPRDSAPATPAFIRRLNLTALLLLSASVILMGIRTAVRNTDWKNNIALAISTARDNPQSGKALAWAGATLIVSDRDDYVQFGKLLLERSIELSPDYVNARWEIAKYWGLRHDMANSAICVAEAAKLDPGSRMTRAAIPALMQEMSTHAPESYMPAILDYQQQHPDDAAACFAIALAYHAQRDLDHAEIYARKAIDMCKHVRADGFDQFHEAGAELAAIWYDRGDIKQAVDKLRVYVAYLQHSVDGRCALAAMLLTLDPHKYPDALIEADFHLAVARDIDPNNIRARTLRGQLNGIRKSLNSEATASAEPSHAHASENNP